MKKLYLVLNISVALLSSNTTLLYKYLPKHIQIKKEESSKVFNILEQFLTPRKPLNINYLGPEHEKLSAKTSIVTQVIKQALKKVDPIFTDKCLSKISLGDTSMIPGKSVKVPLFYHLEHYEGSYIKMDIYIKEHADASQQTTVKKIADKIKLELHLKNFCYQQRMDTPSVAQDIREALVGQHVLSAAEAQYVQPEHFLIFSGNKYRLRVIKGGLAAYSQFNLFIVNRHAKIIHWECNDNVLHFIAYFTPGDYIVLRKVMNAMPESYFLGTFIQILNDGEYDNAEADSNFRIPTLDKIKDYTTAYRHIFS